MTKKGFTLLELLISVAIVSLVGVAVYSVFANGIGAWRRGNRDRTYARNIRLISEKMARELRNSYKFSEIAFEGSQDSIMFPALVSTDTDEGSYYQVGRVAYFYDEEEKALFREEKSYPEVFSDKEPGEGKILIEDIYNLEFSYCYLDNATGEYKWKDDWKKEEQDSIPQAIKIEMSFQKDPDQEDMFSRIIFIPIGTGEQKIKLGSIIMHKK